MADEPFVDFGGMRVLVTGGSSGIGRAISIEVSRRNARVIVVGRDEDRLRETVSALEGEGHDILILNLESLDEITPRVRDLARRVGPIYGFCHAAGTVDTIPLSSTGVDKMTGMMAVNLFAGIELARAVCRRDVMEETGGSVLFISSIYGIIGMPGEVAYSASKGAVIAACRTMAVELARRKIRVNTLCPGFVKTAMTEEAFARLPATHKKKVEDGHPLGVGTPEDVARAAVFLLSPQSRWITGTNFVIDGGYTAQ